MRGLVFELTSAEVPVVGKTLTELTATELLYCVKAVPNAVVITALEAAFIDTEVLTAPEIEDISWVSLSSVVEDVVYWVSNWAN